MQKPKVKGEADVSNIDTQFENEVIVDSIVDMDELTAMANGRRFTKYSYDIRLP